MRSGLLNNFVRDHNISFGFRMEECMETPDFVKEFIAGETWTFAKTYADRAPHEYVVRGKQKSSDEEYMAVVSYIVEHGITMHFWNHPNQYIFVDGYQYWMMKDSDDDPSMVLNRCDLSQYKSSIEWKGKQV